MGWRGQRKETEWMTTTGARDADASRAPGMFFKNIISFFNFTNDILGTIYNDDGMIEQQGVLRKPQNNGTARREKGEGGDDD